MQEAAPLNLHTVADFAVKAGALLLASGAAAAEVVEAMLAVAQQAGIENVSVDVTYSELTFSYRPDNGVPSTRIQTIHQRTFNYGKLTDVLRLVERFCQGQLAMSEAEAEPSSIATSPGPYPWWLTRLAVGFAGGSAALVFGGGWVVMLAAFVANIVLDYLLGVLARHSWLTFYMQATSVVIAVLAAVVIHFIDPSIDSSRVVVSVIIVMLAGMTSTGAIQDAITGWYLTALARLFEAVMNTIGLIVGIVFGILVADRFGVELSISANISMGALQLPVILLASAFAAIGFSFVAQNPPRILLPTALLSAIGYAVYLAAGAAHLGVVWSSAAAAFVIGIIAVLYTQWFKAPAAAFAICAILPLLPGVLLYQGLLGVNGLTSLVNALGTALALAGGLTFGEYVMSVLWRQLRLVENRFFAPLFAEPFATSTGRAAEGKRRRGLPTKWLRLLTDQPTQDQSSASPDEGVGEEQTAQPEEDRAPAGASDDHRQNQPGSLRRRLLPTTRQAIQVALAAGLATLAGTWLSSNRWYWAALTAFVIFTGTASRGETLVKAWQRAVGTLAEEWSSVSYLPPSLAATWWSRSSSSVSPCS